MALGGKLARSASVRGAAPVAEIDGAGVVQKRFVYAEGVNVPELMIVGGNTYRIVKDHLGSVLAVVDQAAGGVAQRIDYEAWGRVLADSSPGMKPFGFAGGLYDPETSLVRFGVRDYDPGIGKWLARDPIGPAGGLNEYEYEYGRSQPIWSLAPTGRVPFFTTWTDPTQALEFLGERLDDLLSETPAEEFVGSAESVGDAMGIPPLPGGGKRSSPYRDLGSDPFPSFHECRKHPFPTAWRINCCARACGYNVDTPPSCPGQWSSRCFDECTD